LGFVDVHNSWRGERTPRSAATNNVAIVENRWGSRRPAQEEGKESSPIQKGLQDSDNPDVFPDAAAKWLFVREWEGLIPTGKTFEELLPGLLSKPMPTKRIIEMAAILCQSLATTAMFRAICRSRQAQIA
jgi:hypothetical protein